VNIITGSQRWQLKCAYLAPLGVLVATRFWSPAAWLWLALFAWYLLAWKRQQSPNFKQAYADLVKTMLLHVTFLLLAFGAFMMAGEYKYGGLSSPAGQQNFGYLIIFLLLGCVLFLAGTIWPMIRVVRSYRRLMSMPEQLPHGRGCD